MAYARLKRPSASRKALLRDLVTDALLHGRIQTTETKAKQIQPIVEKMITFGKQGTLHARREVARFVRVGRSITTAEVVGDKKRTQHDWHVNAVQRLFDEIAPRYQDRTGGYTRLVKIGPRRGDGTMMVYLELV